MKKTLRRVTSIVMILVFCFFMSMGVFVQSARAVAVLDDAIIAIIIAALAACGISLTANGGFNSIADYLSELYYEFCTAQGISIEQSLKGVQYGRNSTGKVLLNNRFVILIDTFVLWLKNRLGLNDNELKILSSSQFITVVDGEGFNVYIPLAYVTPTGTRPSYPSSEYVNVFTLYHGFEVDEVYHLQSGYYCKFVDTGSSLRLKISINEDMSVLVFDEQMVSGSNYTSYKYSYSNPRINGNNKFYGGGEIPVFYIDRDNTYDFIYMAQYQYGSNWGETYLFGYYMTANNVAMYFMPSSDRISANTGVITAPSENPDYTEGDGAILDIGATWGDTLPDMLDDVIPDQLENEGELEAGIEFAGEQEIAEEVEAPGEPSISNDANDYSVPGLESVFPFCIPFDMYNFAVLLAAEPEAPNFEWRLYIEGVVDYTFEIDLSSFDVVAQILRTMELLVFCVALAAKTRDLIRG